MLSRYFSFCKRKGRHFLEEKVTVLPKSPKQTQPKPVHSGNIYEINLFLLGSVIYFIHMPFLLQPSLDIFLSKALCIRTTVAGFKNKTVCAAPLLTSSLFTARVLFLAFITSFVFLLAPLSNGSLSQLLSICLRIFNIFEDSYILFDHIHFVNLL